MPPKATTTLPTVAAATIAETPTAIALVRWDKVIHTLRKSLAVVLMMVLYRQVATLPKVNMVGNGTTPARSFTWSATPPLQSIS